MTRLRFFRILVPALLLPFLVVLALMMRERPSPTIVEAPQGSFEGPRAESIELTDLAGGARRLAVKVRRIEQGEGGNLRLEGIERLVLDRENAPPLVVSAERGDVDGMQGQRLLRLEGGVRVHEEGGDGFLLSLPTLEVDEASGEARSAGEVSLEYASHRGRAAWVVHGLKGQPTEIGGLEMSGPGGFSLTCQKARLLEATRDVELSGEVRVRRGGAAVDAEALRLRRDASRRLRDAEGSGGVSGSGGESGAADLRFAAGRAKVRWDEAGNPVELALEEEASLLRAGSSLAAAAVHAAREGAGPNALWRVRAVGSVRADGAWGGGPARLEAERLVAEVDPKGAVRSAEIDGAARFEGRGISAEAASIRVEVSPAPGRAKLRSGPDRRARLARERSRVAADRIDTDLEGNGFRAEGRVEATLLGASEASRSRPAGGVFRPGDAVHFVSASLEGRASGGRLVFEGAVRGWQGERNLSADRVEIVENPEELHASGSVATRLPRLTAAVASESDYVRITAERLDYAGEDARVVYTGRVLVRQAEGWLEADRVEVSLAPGSERVREVTAAGKIRLEFRSSDREGMPEPVVGQGDRVVYSPEDRTVRLIGDAAPATLRRVGREGGTTSGRVLRYRLDAGTIEVESGDRDRARIRSAGN